jgi:acyl carrier protein phosphodiesterase
MNYLAHLFIADEVNDSLIGHLLGDFVKGAAIRNYDRVIQDAIRFHRKIDSFSDAHELTRASRSRIRRPWRRFAGIVVDVCYDHFLARSWHRFSDEALPEFVRRVYVDLQSHRCALPDEAEQVLKRMISYDWLNSYQDLNKVGIALDRIAGRLTRGERFLGSIHDVQANYTALQEDFLSFFPELVYFALAFKQNMKG